MTRLADELHALQDRLSDLHRYERIVLDLAAVLAEELIRLETGTLPDRVTTIALDDYLENRLPDTFEYLDGRPRPKHWQAYVEVR